MLLSQNAKRISFTFLSSIFLRSLLHFRTLFSHRQFHLENESEKGEKKEDSYTARFYSNIRKYRFK